MIDRPRFSLGRAWYIIPLSVRDERIPQVRGFGTMLVKEESMLVKDELTHAEIKRILHSQTFRNAEVLRVLLRFLGEKSMSGEADQLKEYTIGIDALGKPSTYDPRQDSGVRIQVGRLRQKLAEYYRLEGKD